MKHKRNNSNRIFWLVAGAASALLIVIAVVFSAATMSFDGDSARRVYIPRNSTAEAVHDSLTSAFGDRYGTRLYRIWSIMGGDPTASVGSYVVEPGTSVWHAARQIAKGRQTAVRVTLNNMRTLDDLATKLSARLEASPEDFRNAIDSISVFYDDEFKAKEEYAAAFLPDTYEFYWTESPMHVIGRLIRKRNRFWNKPRKDKAEALGLTPVQVATIASIVEEESRMTDEYPTIARLYINRVHNGMKLQADPTVKFAVGDFTIRRINGEHIKTDSPYNTYKYAGLPPGPIRIASGKTIDAVLDAPEHDYLYMCAKEDFSGYHNFATDYATHMANARRYQAELNKRNIH